jgi:hypothetical protein
MIIVLFVKFVNRFLHGFSTRRRRASGVGLRRHCGVVLFVGIALVAT